MIFCFTCRALVRDVVKVKQEHYAINYPKKQMTDEYLDTYFEQNIVSFWPSGWMKKEELRSECDKR